jgi:plastocyanin
LNRNPRARASIRSPLLWILFMALLIPSFPAGLRGVTVKGRVNITGGAKKADPSPTVVWLTPLLGAPAAAADARQSSYELVQKNKQFHPHLLVVPVGAKVEFPNRDPFFHNVFSLFDGKRFDLGLYEAGSTRSISFNRAGVSYIFCNIHPEMSAVIIVLKTPYYGISSPSGEISIPGVPPGRYRLEVWREGGLPEDFQKFAHEISVSEDSAFLGTLHFNDTDRSILTHKNLYGRDYDEPKSSSNPLYENPR